MYCSRRGLRLADAVQVYQSILQILHEPPMFKACFGLLLRDDLHHAFDRLEWSLYHKVIEPFLSVDPLALCPTLSPRSLSTAQFSSLSGKLTRSSRTGSSTSISSYFPIETPWRCTERQSLLTASVECRANGLIQDLSIGITHNVLRPVSVALQWECNCTCMDTTSKRRGRRASTVRPAPWPPIEAESVPLRIQEGETEDSAMDEKNGGRRSCHWAGRPPLILTRHVLASPDASLSSADDRSLGHV
jgi:hypothetical protein